MNQPQHDSGEHLASVDDSAPPTQAQLYDDLRRIGQLEDQKYALQQEIDERTARLRQAIPSLDRTSLLFKMLSSSLGPTAAANKAKSTRPRPAKKKTSKKSGG